MKFFIPVLVCIFCFTANASNCSTELEGRFVCNENSDQAERNFTINILDREDSSIRIIEHLENGNLNIKEVLADGNPRAKLFDGKVFNTAICDKSNDLVIVQVSNYSVPEHDVHPRLLTQRYSINNDGNLNIELQSDNDFKSVSNCRRLID